MRTFALRVCWRNASWYLQNISSINCETDQTSQSTETHLTDGPLQSRSGLNYNTITSPVFALGHQSYRPCEEGGGIGHRQTGWHSTGQHIVEGPPIVCDFLGLKNKLSLQGLAGEVLTICREDKTAPSQYANKIRVRSLLIKHAKCMALTSWTDKLELAVDVSWPLWRFKGIDGN